MLQHHVNNYFYQSWNIDGDFNLFVVYHFGQTFDNDENQVIAIALPVSRQ